VNRRRVLAAALAAATSVAACSAGDRPTERSADPAPTTTLPPAAESTTTAPTTTTTTVPPVEWEACGSAQCATVPTPIDHDAPDAGTIDLFVSRLPATGDRIGALFVNFGGPGAGAADRLDTFPDVAEVRRRFDIVAVDPRGVGRSAPLDCGVAPVRLFAVDHTVEDDRDAEALVEISEEFGVDCQRRHGALLPHLGTRAVARDLDRVRAAMGDEQLSYLGYSYGTVIGQVYADLFPARVRAMVLDGMVDPAVGGIEAASEQGAGLDRSLARWAAGCRSRSSCPFGDGALGAVDQVLARAEGGIASPGGARALGPGEAPLALSYPMYLESAWSRLDEALAAALDGDGRDLVALADDQLSLVALAPYYAVSCLDSDWPRDPAEHLERAERAAVGAARFGEAVVNDYVRCATWPAAPDPLGPVTAAGAPPILVVSTTGDGVTPHATAIRVAERLVPATLLTHEGEGHTVVFRRVPCVDRIVSAYLVDLVVPPPGVRC
jgi:pimeloyl-ACP methyl ester carboxylesterase